MIYLVLNLVDFQIINEKNIDWIELTKEIRMSIYDFKFNTNEKVKIQNYFESIYANEETKLFKNALETIISKYS